MAVNGVPLNELPVASVLSSAVAASRDGAVVVTAPPGSGKTMLVPAAVLDDLPSPQKVILIQPRRLAARAVARLTAPFDPSAPGVRMISAPNTSSIWRRSTDTLSGMRILIG